MRFLCFSAVGAGLVLGLVAWQVITVADNEIAQTIDAEAEGLIDNFNTGGLRRLGAGDRGALRASPAPRSIC